MKKLTKIYGLKEGPFDDVQQQLNRSQSVLGGPTTAPSVRKYQDRAKRHSPATARAQSELDSARSIFDEAPMFGRPGRQASVEIDVMDASEAEADAKRMGVEFEVVDQHGPGGGNPLVKVTGPVDKIIKLLVRWDPDDVSGMRGEL